LISIAVPPFAFEALRLRVCPEKSRTKATHKTAIFMMMPRLSDFLRHNIPLFEERINSSLADSPDC
jgi:hypothetical protein